MDTKKAATEMTMAAMARMSSRLLSFFSIVSLTMPRDELTSRVASSSWTKTSCCESAMAAVSRLVDVVGGGGGGWRWGTLAMSPWAADENRFKRARQLVLIQHGGAPLGISS